MITSLHCKNIFDSSCQLLVNPVNCKGIMGAGLALQFKLKYPEMFRKYAEYCQAGFLKPGEIYLWRDDNSKGLRKTYVANLATKDNWAEPSKLEWIKTGLDNLVTVMIENNIRSAAIPPIGCGLGGLPFYQVRQLIFDTFRVQPKLDVEIFEPN